MRLNYSNVRNKCFNCIFVENYYNKTFFLVKPIDDNDNWLGCRIFDGCVTDKNMTFSYFSKEFTDEKHYYIKEEDFQKIYIYFLKQENDNSNEIFFNKKIINRIKHSLFNIDGEQ